MDTVEVKKGSEFSNALSLDFNDKGIDRTRKTNHINSFTKTTLSNATPYDLAQIFLDKNVLKSWNLVKVPSNKIQLNPRLLKKF